MSSESLSDRVLPDVMLNKSPAPLAPASLPQARNSIRNESVISEKLEKAAISLQWKQPRV